MKVRNPSLMPNMIFEHFACLHFHQGRIISFTSRISVIRNQQLEESMILIEGVPLRNDSAGFHSLSTCPPLKECIGDGGSEAELTIMLREQQLDESLGKCGDNREGTKENRTKLKRIWPNPDTQLRANCMFEDGNQIGRGSQSVSLSAAKVVTLKDRLANTKKHLQQFPSIPNSQVSFGYNFDSQENKMIPNRDPQVLLSQNMQEIRSPNAGRYFFARSPGTIGEHINQLNWRREKSQRAPLSLLHQISYPDSTNYRSEDYNTIAYSLKRSPQQTSACFASCSPRLKSKDESSKREVLLASKMKKDFSSYINEESTQEMAVKDKEVSRDKEKRAPAHEELPSGKAQYFLSKSPRFTSEPEGEIETGITEQESFEREPTKEPFSLGSSRFCLTEKQKLGPGYYETKMDFTGQKGGKRGLIKQGSPRFGAFNIVQGTPGPGAYYDRELKKFKAAVRWPDKDQIRQCGPKMPCKETSMQIMYSQFGKQANLFKTRKSPASKLQVKKTSQINKTNFQMARRKLEEIVMQEAREPEKQRVAKQSCKPYFEHLYSFGLRPQLGKGPLEVANGHNKQLI